MGEMQLPFLYDRNVGILKKLFPKIQFICATHSPFIIQLLEEGELITLDHPLESDYSGDGIEDIAEDVMGVEMPQYSEKNGKCMWLQSSITVQLSRERHRKVLNDWENKQKYTFIKIQSLS